MRAFQPKPRARVRAGRLSKAPRVYGGGTILARGTKDTGREGKEGSTGTLGQQHRKARLSSGKPLISL